MGARGLFTVLVCTACSGQPAPTPDKPTPVIVDAAPPPILPDAPVPSALGGACDGARPCGPDLACEAGFGGTCSSACATAGTPCGDGATCVEYPTSDVCRTSCTTNEECRADEGYACDPVWKGCVLANAPTIAPLTCPPPTGFGRDPAFGPPTALGVARDPVAALAGDGTAVIVQGTRIARLDLAGRLDTVDGMIAGAPAIARDGEVLVVATGTPTQVLLSASRDRGRTWSTPIAIADRECKPNTCTAPMLAVGRGLLYVAYSSEAGIRVHASRDGGASFGPPITAMPGARGSLAVAGDGTLHVVALRGSPLGSYGSGDQEIVYASSSNGGLSFTKPRLISSYAERIPFYFGTPRIEIDSARKWIYIAYTRGGRDGKWDLALVAIKGSGPESRENSRAKPWVRTRIGDDATCAATYLAPQLALDPSTGALHLAWYDSRGPRYAHGVCADGLRLCRQLGRIDDGAFAALSLSRHGAAASETTSLVVDNQRRLLHAVWSQPVGAESRIFHAKAKLPLR